MPLVSKCQPAMTAFKQPMMFSNMGLMRSFLAAQQTVNTESQSLGSFAIKITKNKEVTESDLLNQGLEKARAAKNPVCFYPVAHRPAHACRWSAVKKDMNYSMWKLNAVCTVIRGKSLIDARSTLAAVDKKGAKFVLELLDKLEAQGVKSGRNPEQMYIRTVTVGGGVLFSAPDIKGRGRCGTIRKPKCSMRIMLEEKSAADFYKLMLKGETPVGLSSMFRRMIYQNKGDYEHVRSSTHMLTSNGRRYRRVQFRRLIQTVQKEYRSRGIYMREQKIERNMLEKVAAKFAS